MTEFAFAPAVLATAGSTTLPAWMGDVDLSSITTTATSVAGIVVPVIVAVLGIGLGIKLLKGYIKKISG